MLQCMLLMKISENEMVIDNDVDNDFNDVQLSLQSNVVESGVADQKARTTSSKVIHNFST